MSPTTIEVAFATDRTYVPHAAVMLRSLIASQGPERVRAHFMHPSSLPRGTRERLRAMVESAGAAIEFHPIRASAVRGLPAMDRIPPVMWYRLLLPELLGDEQRVLYLDCDLLVVDDLEPLWRIDLEGCQVGAVTNLLPSDLRHRPAALGLSEAGYFNSGVLLIDLDAWRLSGCAREMAELARRNPERLVFPDQDALNIVLGSSRLALHPRWNCQNSVLYYDWAREVLGEEAVAQARAHPAIVHFEGPAQAKPWHPGSPHIYRDEYLRYRAQTPWPTLDEEREGLAARASRILRGARR